MVASLIWGPKSDNGQVAHHAGVGLEVVVCHNAESRQVMRKPEDEKRSGGSMSDKEGMLMGSDPPAVGV